MNECLTMVIWWVVVFEEADITYQELTGHANFKYIINGTKNGRIYWKIKV